MDRWTEGQLVAQIQLLAFNIFNPVQFSDMEMILASVMLSQKSRISEFSPEYLLVLQYLLVDDDDYDDDDGADCVDGVIDVDVDDDAIGYSTYPPFPPSSGAHRAQNACSK